MRQRKLINNIHKTNTTTLPNGNEVLSIRMIRLLQHLPDVDVVKHIRLREENKED